MSVFGVVMNWIMLPYMGYRRFVIETAFRAWYWLGIKPSAFLFILCITDVYRIITYHINEKPYMLTIGSLMISIAILCCKLYYEQRDDTLGVVLFELDVYPPVVPMLYNGLIVFFVISFIGSLDTINFVGDMLVGFYWITISGESGKLWKLAKAKLSVSQPQRVPAPSKA